MIMLKENALLPSHRNNGYANALQCTLYVVAYLVCIVRWIILVIAIIQHDPSKFLAVLSTWFSQFCCYTSTSSCTDMSVSSLMSQLAILLERTVSEKAKQDGYTRCNQQFQQVLYLMFCGGRHGDVAPCILLEISDVSKMVQEWPFSDKVALMIILP